MSRRSSSAPGPGVNYGWRVKEGTFLFDAGGFQLKGARSDGFPFANAAWAARRI